MNIHYISPDGLRLAAETEGHPDNPVIILLHGGGQTRHAWKDTSSHLAKEGYFTIRYDARGHGESEWSPTGDYSLSAFVSDLKSIMAQLRRPIALVGASLGGLTAVGVAGAVPAESISALLMVDVTLKPRRAGVDRILKFMSANPDGFASINDAVKAVAAYHSLRPRPSSTKGLEKNLRRGPDNRFRWHWDWHFLETDMIRKPDEVSAYLARQSSSIKSPTLLLRGEYSDIVSDAAVAELLTLLPGMDVCTVSGAGHMIAGDNNVCFNEYITDFLRINVPEGSV